MKFTRIAALLLALVLCLSCTACSPEEILTLTDRARDVVSETVEAVSTVSDPENAPLFAPSGDRKADKAVKTLVEETVKCVRNRDKAGFAALFVDADEAALDLWWNNFCSAVDHCGAEHVDAIVVTETEEYIVVGFCL